MTPIDLIGRQPGRAVRVLVGAGLIAAGLRRGDGRGRVVATAGLVPLTVGVADVCLLGPLGHGLLRGQAFREHRGRQRLVH